MLPPNSTCVLSHGVKARGDGSLLSALYLRHQLTDDPLESLQLPTSTPLPFTPTVLETDPCGPRPMWPFRTCKQAVSSPLGGSPCAIHNLHHSVWQSHQTPLLALTQSSCSQQCMLPVCILCNLGDLGSSAHPAEWQPSRVTAHAGDC